MKYLAFFGGDFYSPPIEGIAVIAKGLCVVVGLTDIFVSRAEIIYPVQIFVFSDSPSPSTGKKPGMLNSFKYL